MQLAIKNLVSEQRETFQLNVENINVEKGDIVAIIGANGSGKTTLMESILGLTKTEKRAIELFGNDIGSFDNDGAIRKQLGVQLQKSNFMQGLKVAEVVKIHKLMYGAVNEFCFDKLCISELMPIKYNNLSRGQKQRVDLFMSLAHEPEFVLLDEPSTGLDIEFRDVFCQILNSLKKRGASVLIGTHTESEIAFCNKVIWMESGSVKQFGTCQEIVSETIGHFRNDFQCVNSEVANTLSKLIDTLEDVRFVERSKDCLSFHIYTGQNYLQHIINTIDLTGFITVTSRECNYSDLIKLGQENHNVK